MGEGLDSSMDTFSARAGILVANFVGVGFSRLSGIGEKTQYLYLESKPLFQ